MDHDELQLYAKLDEIINEFEGRTTPFWEIDIDNAIRGLVKEYKDLSAVPLRVLSEGIAFCLSEHGSSDTSRWGGYYGPKVTWQGKDGVEYESPEFELITPEMVEYWQQRADVATHPLLKARYAGLAWDLSHRVTGSRSDVRFAQMTIDSIVEYIDNGQCEHAIDAHCKLKRALELALRLKDEPRVARVIESVIQYERSTADDKKGGTWGFAFDTLIDNQRKAILKDDQRDEIVSELESRMQRFASASTPDPFLVESAALRLARYYKRCNNQGDLRRVLSVYVNTWLVLAKQAMPLLGVAWLQKVHQTLLEYGLKEDADALEPQLRSIGAGAHNNLAKVSHTARFKKEEIDQFVDEITAGSLTDTLHRIAARFLPDPDRAQRELLQINEQSQLMSRFTRRTIDADGRIVDEVGPLEQDLEGYLIKHMSDEISWWHPFLRLAFEHAQSRHSLSASDVVEHLYQSPVFAPESRPLIERGLQSYVDNDHAVAIHLLIPQIECTMRGLMQAAGGPIYEKGRHGGTNLRNLGKLLSDKRIVDALSERIATYFQVLLTDQRGWNLRNLVCHGMLDPRAFGPMVADRVVHALLLLGLMRESDEQ